MHLTCLGPCLARVPPILPSPARQTPVPPDTPGLPCPRPGAHAALGLPVSTWATGPWGASSPPAGGSGRGWGGRGLPDSPLSPPSRGPAMLHLPGANGGVQLRPHRHLRGQRNHVQDHTLLPGDGSVPGRAGGAVPGVSTASPARTLAVAVCLAQWALHWCWWEDGGRVTEGGRRGGAPWWVLPEARGQPDAGAPPPQCTPSWGTSR